MLCEPADICMHECCLCKNNIKRKKKLLGYAHTHIIRFEELQWVYFDSTELFSFFQFSNKKREWIWCLWVVPYNIDKEKKLTLMYGY